MKYIYGFEKFNESVEVTQEEMELYKNYIERISNLKLKNLTKDDIYKASLPYFIKYSTKEEILKWWNEIGHSDGFKFIKILKDANNEPSRLPTDEPEKFYYIAEISYAVWTTEARYLFPENTPIKFIKNMDSTIKTSMPDNKYHGFIYCSNRYFLLAFSIMKKFPKIFNIITPIELPENNPIEMRRTRLATKFEPRVKLSYDGCWDKFVEIIGNKDITELGGEMSELGF